MANKSKRKAPHTGAEGGQEPPTKTVRKQLYANARPSTFHLLQLPTEIVVAIAGHLPPKSLHNLVLVNRNFHSLLERTLYLKDTAAADCSLSLLWAAIHNRPATATKAIAAGAKIDGARSKPVEELEDYDEDERYRGCEFPSVPSGYGLKSLVPLAYCGQSPLFIAAYKGYLQVAKVLMEHGAALDWVTKWQNTMTAPSAAAAKGHLPIVKYIHESGYDLGQDRSYHGKILHCAAHHGRIAVVKYLVDQCRMDILAEDDRGCVPLHVAVRDSPDGATAVVKFLLSHMPANHHSLRLALDTAVGNGGYRNYEMVELLLGSGKVDCTQDDDSGMTPVGRAAFTDNRFMVETLLQYDCIDPNRRDSEGRTPLMIARTALGYGEGVLTALLHSPSVNHADKQAIGPEMFRRGCWTRNTHFVHLLLDLKIAGDNYTELFHLAGESQMLSIVERLMKDHAVPVDSVRGYGLTPLQYACTKGWVRDVEFYANNGANTSLLGSAGLPLLHGAAQEGPVGVIRALLRAETDPNLPAEGTHETPLHIACREGKMERVSALLEFHADPMRLTAAGLTAHHYAIRCGSEKVVKWLMWASKPPPELLQDGWTLLHEACQVGNTAIVRAVLKQRANVAAKADNGETPLHVAISGRHSGVVQILLQKGADMLSAADDGSTPAAIAAKIDDAGLESVLSKFTAQGLGAKAKVSPQKTSKKNGTASSSSRANTRKKAASGTRRSSRNKA